MLFEIGTLAVTAALTLGLATTAGARTIRVAHVDPDDQMTSKKGAATHVFKNVVQGETDQMPGRLRAWSWIACDAITVAAGAALVIGAYALVPCLLVRRTLRLSALLRIFAGAMKDSSMILITASLGLCLFVVEGIANVGMVPLTRAILPFFLFEVLVLIILTSVPQAVIWLPRAMGFRWTMSGASRGRWHFTTGGCDV